MTRHDPLVQTAAPPREPTGWFAPGAPATITMHANLFNIIAAGARSQPLRRLSAESERHEQRRTPSVRPRQNGKPHSAVHADRGFLHGWLCDAKRHPKPFTISVVNQGFASA